MSIPRVFAVSHWLLALAFTLLLPAQWASAHQPSQSFLDMTSEPMTPDWNTHWDIALRDLDMVLDLDQNLDGRLTRAEIASARQAIEELALRNATFTTEESFCRPGSIDQSLVTRRGIGYVRLGFAVACPTPATPVTLKYELFEQYDAGHRLWLTTNELRRVLQPGNTAVLHGDPQQATGWLSFGSFVREGIHHILIGWDHLAFVLALLATLLLGQTRATNDGATPSKSQFNKRTRLR